MTSQTPAVNADDVITSVQWSDDVAEVSSSLIQVSSLDHLPGITPEMFSWWFANMDKELYFKFHPHDHKDFAWTRGKRPNEYVGATHMTHHQYSGVGPIVRSEISFVEPATMFSSSALTSLDDGVALSADVHMLDELNVPSTEQAGRFAHVGIRRESGLELRCRWWLKFGPDSDFDLMTTKRLAHVHSEFACLVEFLPDLYAQKGPR